MGFRVRLIGPLREGSREMFKRAIARGEIAATMPVDVALDMLVAPLYYRLLLRTGPLDARFADEVVDLLLAALLSRFGSPPEDR